MCAGYTDGGEMVGIGNCHLVGARKVMLISHFIVNEGKTATKIKMKFGDRVVELNELEYNHVGNAPVAKNPNKTVVHHQTEGVELQVADVEAVMLTLPEGKEYELGREFGWYGLDDGKRIFKGSNLGNRGPFSECEATYNPEKGNGGAKWPTELGEKSKGLDTVNSTHFVLRKQRFMNSLCLIGFWGDPRDENFYVANGCGSVGKLGKALFPHSCPTASEGGGSAAALTMENPQHGSILYGLHVGSVCSKRNRKPRQNEGDSERCKSAPIKFNLSNYNVGVLARTLPLEKLLDVDGVP